MVGDGSKEKTDCSPPYILHPMVLRRTYALTRDAGTWGNAWCPQRICLLSGLNYLSVVTMVSTMRRPRVGWEGLLFWCQVGDRQRAMKEEGRIGRRSSTKDTTERIIPLKQNWPSHAMLGQEDAAATVCAMPKYSANQMMIVASRGGIADGCRRKKMQNLAKKKMAEEKRQLGGFGDLRATSYKQHIHPFEREEVFRTSLTPSQGSGIPMADTRIFESRGQTSLTKSVLL
ncbi:hypothetical protein C8R43DRAFT_359203 [Mycena crocata]|nr:hypothetical protein C8R43DRAFT_359203 [Mycena crocata]